MGHIGDIKGPRGRTGETRIGPRPQGPSREGPKTPAAGNAFQSDGMEPAVPRGEGTRIVRSPFAAPMEPQGEPPPTSPSGDVPRGDAPRTTQTPSGNTPRTAPEPADDTADGDVDSPGQTVLTEMSRGEGSRIVRIPLPPTGTPRNGNPDVPGRPGANPPEMSGNGAALPLALGSAVPGTDTAPSPELPPSTAGEASPMSSFRIPSALARLLPTSVGGGEGALRPGHPKGTEGGPRPRQGDIFRTPPPPPAGRPPLAGDERPPVKSVEELVPPGLEDTAGQEELGHRFGSDAALLAAHLKPSQLSGSERATRLWAFFAAYAEAAAAKPPQEEAKAAFREGLEGQGFAELRDAHTQENGVDRALWVLNARSPEEVRERAATVRLEPPPDVRHSEAASRQESQAAEQPLALPPGARNLEVPRGTLVPVRLEAREADTEEEQEEARKRKTNRKLGKQMLWNVLHRFRSDPEDGALADANWDRATFGAMLALAAIALMVAALVSL